MAIECYYRDCRFHSNQTDPDDGPFCDERECRATCKEIEAFALIRQQFLDKVYKNGSND